MAMAEERFGGVVFPYDTQASAVHHESRLWAFFKEAFLPFGYPSSVSEDYLEYQLWDTAQAFCSSITNILSSHALLTGYGVGQQGATAGAALITWMLRDGTAMVGRILFAWLYGTALDNNSKSWRLFADVLNDGAIALEIASPNFPSLFVGLACIGSLGKAIVSVAGGATRAALTQHQARRNNLGDVTSKDGSQEQLVQLMAMLVGLSLTPVLDDLPKRITWVIFALLTAAHLYANYRAVSCVVFSVLNSQRARLVVRHYLQTDQVWTPRDVAQREPLFTLRGSSDRVRVHLGARLANLQQGASIKDSAWLLRHLSQHRYDMRLFRKRGHAGDIYVVLGWDATAADVLRAYLHALIIEAAVSGLAIDSASAFTPDEAALWETMTRHSGRIGDEDQLVDSSFALASTLLPRLQQRLAEKKWEVGFGLISADEWRVALKKTE